MPDPESISSVILTHAHFDHCGMLPLLAKRGYRGNIYATPATRDLAGVVMMDSAAIQARDAEYLGKQAARGATGSSGSLSTTRTDVITGDGPVRHGVVQPAHAHRRRHQGRALRRGAHPRLGDGLYARARPLGPRGHDSLHGRPRAQGQADHPRPGRRSRRWTTSSSRRPTATGCTSPPTTRWTSWPTSSTRRWREAARS